MKLRMLVSAIAVCALLAMPAAALQTQSQPQTNGGTESSATPLMVIESFTHDFGEVKAGTPLRFAFKVKNQGKADLLINNVSPG